VIGVLLLSALLPFFWVSPDWSTILFGMLIDCAATAGHSLIIVAFRYGDASVLAPFTYTQLVWVTGLGILIFGAIPDRWTVAGATVIVSSGLYIADRERIRSREKAISGAQTPT
jgi:drug/metabolite transporter (DMT)-like permease